MGFNWGFKGLKEKCSE